MSKDPPKNLSAWLGFASPPRYQNCRLCGHALVWILSALILLLTATGIGALLKAFATVAFGEGSAEELRGLAYIVIGFLGAPLLIWRTWVGHKQTQIQDASLLHDKINAAYAELHSRREVTTKREKEEGEVYITTMQEDDLIRRVAAMDRLENLALTHLAEARSIARIFCTYVKELSKQYPPEEMPEDLEPLMFLSLAGKLKVKRADMEAAVQSLSRINTALIEAEGKEAVKVKPVINLEECNLQGMTLTSLDLRYANLTNAHLQGAIVQYAHLQDAVMLGAHLQGAHMVFAELQGAYMVFAELQGASMQGAKLQGVDMYAAKLQGAVMLGAHLQGAYMLGAKLRHTSLLDINGAEALRSAFGDDSVSFNHKEDRPAHWPDVILDDADYEAEYEEFYKNLFEPYNRQERKQIYGEKYTKET